MQQVHFLAVPVGLGTARPERPHAHVHQRWEAFGDDLTIEAACSTLAQRCVVDQDVGASKLALQHSLTCCAESRSHTRLRLPAASDANSAL